MAWRKITLEDENLQCDISDEDVRAAVHDLRNQFRDAGVILSKRSVQKPYHHKVVIRKKSIS